MLVETGGNLHWLHRKSVRVGALSKLDGIVEEAMSWEGCKWAVKVRGKLDLLIDQADIVQQICCCCKYHSRQYLFCGCGCVELSLLSLVAASRS